jgi:hypothetical protein
LLHLSPASSIRTVSIDISKLIVQASAIGPAEPVLEARIASAMARVPGEKDRSLEEISREVSEGEIQAS